MPTWRKAAFRGPGESLQRVFGLGRLAVLGAMAAHCLGALFGLLAVFPILALPFLLGGVKAGEFWRLLLDFVLTMLSSLALGVFVSTRVREVWEAWGRAGSSNR